MMMMIIAAGSLLFLFFTNVYDVMMMLMCNVCRIYKLHTQYIRESVAYCIDQDESR
jgi:hypothetical protein